jgi:hypothetical protein
LHLALNPIVRAGARLLKFTFETCIMILKALETLPNEAPSFSFEGEMHPLIKAVRT